MKALIVLVLLAGLFYGTANAQKTVRLNSAPKAFRTFFTNFRNAVARGNKPAVASMTRFPFQYGFDAGDEGTWSRSQFIAKYSDIFDSEKTLFANKDPEFYVEGGRFSLTNNEQASHFTFVRTGGSYRLKSYIVEP